MSLNVIGNNSFLYITYNYNSFINEISNENLTVDQIVSIMNGELNANSQILPSEFNTFKTLFYKSPINDINLTNIVYTSERNAYISLYNLNSGTGSAQAIPPYPGSLVKIQGNPNFKHSRFDYDKLLTNIENLFSNIQKQFTKEEIAEILNETKNTHTVLNEMNIDITDFRRSIFKLPVSNFDDFGIHSEVSSLNNLNNTTDLNSAINLALPSYDDIPPNNPIVNFLQKSNSNTNINVNLSNDVVKWEYSVNNGTNWNTSNNNSFTLNDGTYNKDQIIVRNYDYTGNFSDTTNDFEISIKSDQPNLLNAQLLSNKTTIELVFDDELVVNNQPNITFSENINVVNISLDNLNDKTNNVLKLTIDEFNGNTLNISFNTVNIKDTYGNNIILNNETINIENDIELHIDNRNGDFYYKVNKNNINVLQLEFASNITTATIFDSSKFNLLFDNKKIIVWANNNQNFLEKDEWTKLMTIVPTSNLANGLFSTKDDLFTNYNIVITNKIPS